MNNTAREMLKAESAYLAGVKANFEAAKGKQLRGSIWRTARDDDSDRLRALMASRRMYDRERLKELPQNRRIALHGFERTWWFRKRPTGVAIASVLCPLDHAVAPEDDEAPRISLGTLLDHVRKLVSDPSVPYVIGVCAPSGFTDEARTAKLDLPNVSLALVEPTSGGGWRVTGAGDDLPGHALAMFDPERANEKIDRVKQVIQQRSADLLTGSLSAASVASQLDLSQDIVSGAFEQVAAADPELKLTRKSGEVLLFRGAPVRREEKTSMNVVDRIRQLFAKEGDEAQKINVLAERRARLSERRDRIYGDVGQLESKEQELVRQGRQNKSTVARRRLAAQLAQLRKDITRQNTTANMLNQQMNVISTDIHNLTLIQQGNMAQLPDTEELTQNAVKAEEMLESLKVDAELVSSLETGLSDAITSAEELAILKEFDEPETAPPAPEPAASSAEPLAETEEPPAEPEAEPGRPEPEAT